MVFDDLNKKIGVNFANRSHDEFFEITEGINM